MSTPPIAREDLIILMDLMDLTDPTMAMDLITVMDLTTATDRTIKPETWMYS